MHISRKAIYASFVLATCNHFSSIEAVDVLRKGISEELNGEHLDALHQLVRKIDGIEDKLDKMGTKIGSLEETDKKYYGHIDRRRLGAIFTNKAIGGSRKSKKSTDRSSSTDHKIFTNKAKGGSRKSNKSTDRSSSTDHKMEDLQKQINDLTDALNALIDRTNTDGEGIDDLTGRTNTNGEALGNLTNRTESLESCNEVCLTPPPDIPCNSTDARKEFIMGKLPDDCVFENANETDIGRNRLICTSTPDDPSTLLPDMCNASVLLVGGGGAGGQLSFCSSGGGAGQLVLEKFERIPEGLWHIEVGEGGFNTLVLDEDAFKNIPKIVRAQASHFQPLTATGINPLTAIGGGNGGPPFFNEVGDTLATEGRRGFDGGSGGGASCRLEFPRCGDAGGQCVTSYQGGLALGSGGNNGGSVGPNINSSGGGGGAGQPGQGSDDILFGVGGNGTFVGDVIGNFSVALNRTLGQPAGWFAGGGHAAGNFNTFAFGAVLNQPTSLGGGGAGCIDPKNCPVRDQRDNTTINDDIYITAAFPNTGGGGGGQKGGITEQENCTDQINPGRCRIVDKGKEIPFAVGGSGILVIVFDTCGCEDK